MQTVSSNLLNSLASDNLTAKRLSVVVEFYTSSALPTAAGFDPAGADLVLAVANVNNATFRGREYKRLIRRVGDVKRTLRKELSSFSVELSNAEREIVQFEYATGFEGLICVVRLIDRNLTANLADSLVLFTGRCEKPDTFDRSSESVSISVKQILSQTELIVPRRRLTPEDEEGRSPSDPLFEGFRFVQRYGSFPIIETIKKRFLLFLSRKKTVTRYQQYSSHSDLDSEKYLPLALGRVQAPGIQLAYEDVGWGVHGLVLFCEGKIKGVYNLRSVTPGLNIIGTAIKLGYLGGVDHQTNDDPSWVGAGVYSRTAYARYVASGSELTVEDPAPDIVAILLGLEVPLPNSSGNFALSDWTDNPVYLSRWALNDPNIFNLADAWFDNDDIIENADYCNHILVDQSNTDLVMLHQSQNGVAGTGYQNYQSTGAVSPHLFLGQSGGDVGIAARQPIEYEFYENLPINGDDPNGTGIAAAPTTKYRRRYTANVLLSEEQKATDFLFDVLFPAANMYLTQTAAGKLSLKVARPADYAFVHAANAIGASALKVKNINPFKTKPGRILLGANLPTSEVRTVTGARFDATVSIAISASGGVSASGAALSGGSDDVAPNATLTVSSASGTKTINIDGYVLTYVPDGANDTAVSVAGMIAALINSHNELNKYIKAVWTPGAATVTVSSRIGFLDFDSPLAAVHNAPIANPTAAPTVANNSGNLIGGAYQISYSFETIEGETLTSPAVTHTVGTGGGVYCYPISLPDRVLRVNWYASVEPGGIRRRLVKTNDGSGWTFSTAPRLDDAIEPVYNSTAAECHRIAMAFSDRSYHASGLTRSNMLKGTFKFPMGSKQPSTNVVKMKYREASQDFQLTELVVRDKKHIDKVKKKNPREINGAAVDNYHQASRLLNQKMAEWRDGDFFTGHSSDGEALLLEEGDIICITDDSAKLRNEPVRVEDLLISEGGGFPKIAITGRKYRRRFYDDQVREKLVSLPLVVNAPTNTETAVPAIWQYSAATNTAVSIGVNGYTTNARYRKVDVSANADMSAAASFSQEASLFANNLLPSVVAISKTGEASAVTRYIRVSHSSNNVTFGDPSNVITVTFAASGGTGGSGGSSGGIGPGGPCFTGDHSIRLATGKRLSFVELWNLRDEYISNGEIRSFDDSGEIQIDRIGKVFRHEVFEYLQVKFSNGATFNVTKEHPFFHTFKNCVPIGDKKVGESVLTRFEDWKNASIESIELVELSKGIWVYNLHAIRFNRYFVSDVNCKEDFGVHNLKEILI